MKMAQAGRDKVGVGECECEKLLSLVEAKRWQSSWLVCTVEKFNLFDGALVVCHGRAYPEASTWIHRLVTLKPHRSHQ